jgi:hypothetical protein
MSAVSDAGATLRRQIEAEGKYQWKEGALDALQGSVEALQIAIDSLKGSPLEAGIDFSIQILRTAHKELKGES